METWPDIAEIDAAGRRFAERIGMEYRGVVRERFNEHRRAMRFTSESCGVSREIVLRLGESPMTTAEVSAMLNACWDAVVKT